MQRDGFVFYRSFYEAISCLDKEQKADCLDAVAQYALNGVEVETNGIVRALFISFKPQIDANNRRYENGCKGGKPKRNQAETKQKPNDNQNVTEEIPKEKDKEKEKEKDKDKEKVKEKKKTTTALYQELKTDYPLSENMELTLSDWFKYRDNIKKPLGEKSVIQLIEKTIELEKQHGYLAVKKCFDNSMENGYQGVFFDKINSMKVTPIRDNKSEVDDFFRRELGV